MEKFELLKPPLFTPSGIFKSIDEITPQDWIATFNLWIIRSNNSILYQQRSLTKAWAPGKLDVIVGGKVSAGESVIAAGLREALEEIGKDLDEKSFKFIGRNLHVGLNKTGKVVNTVPHIFFTINNDPLNTFKLINGEVDGIYECNIDELIKLHKGEIANFSARGISKDKQDAEINVTLESFPENWDNYHYKVARLAKEYLEGKEDLLY